MVLHRYIEYNKGGRVYEVFKLKKITAVVLSIGMVFSSSAVTGFAADNSKKIATIPNSYINKVAEDIDNEYFYDGTYVDDWGHTRKGRQLGATYTKQSTEFCYGHLRQHM